MKPNALLLGAIVLGCPCIASAVITFSDIGTGTRHVTRNASTANGWEIEFEAIAGASNQAYTVLLRANDVNDSIRYVRVTTSQGAGVSGAWIVVGIAPDNFSSDTIPILHEVTRVVSAGSIPLSVGATNIGQLGTSAGDPGEITAQSIGNLVTVKNAGLTGYTGDVFAPITANGTGPSFGIIANLDVNNDLLSDVSATHVIESLRADRKVGPTGGSINITATNQILLLKGGEINAVVSCTSGSTPYVQRVETTGANSTTGDFTGSLSTRTLTCGNCMADKGIKVKHDLTASLSFTNLIADSIEIEHSLTGSIASTNGANSGGLVIINSGNGTGAWSGNVTLNGYLLSTGQSQPNQAPYYDRTSSALGGGDVGLVPFQCHLQDSTPLHLATVTTWTPSTSTVTLRHYGKVTWTGMPIKVGWCVVTQDCDLDDHDVSDDWETINSPGTRDVVLRLKSGHTITANRDYHFRPWRTGTTMLKCSGIVASNVPVGDYDYLFHYVP